MNQPGPRLSQGWIFHHTIRHHPSDCLLSLHSQSDTFSHRPPDWFPSVLSGPPWASNIEAKCCMTDYFSNKDQHLLGFILFSHYIGMMRPTWSDQVGIFQQFPGLTTDQRLTRFLYWNRTLMLPSPECKVKYVCFIGNLKCPFRKFGHLSTCKNMVILFCENWI